MNFVGNIKESKIIVNGGWERGGIGQQCGAAGQNGCWGNTQNVFYIFSWENGKNQSAL